MRTRLAWGFFLLMLRPAMSASQELPPLVARPLDFTRVSGASLRGELLAVMQDSVWILASRDRVEVVALRGISQVRVRQSGITAGGLLTWATIGGLVSGGALTAACSSVEGTEGCGAVVPATLAVWLLVGGVAAAITGPGQRHLQPAADALQPYARFPQGLPPGFSLAGASIPPPLPGDSAPIGAARMRW